MSGNPPESSGGGRDAALTAGTGRPPPRQPYPVPGQKAKTGCTPHECSCWWCFKLQLIVCDLLLSIGGSYTVRLVAGRLATCSARLHRATYPRRWVVGFFHLHRDSHIDDSHIISYAARWHEIARRSANASDMAYRDYHMHLAYQPERRLHGGIAANGKMIHELNRLFMQSYLQTMLSAV